MKPGRDGSDFSRFLRHFTLTEWETHSTENSRVGSPTQGSSSCGATHGRDTVRGFGGPFVGRVFHGAGRDRPGRAA
eukprot:2423140-Prymnesium_polylepis.1